MRSEPVQMTSRRDVRRDRRANRPQGIPAGPALLTVGFAALADSPHLVVNLYNDLAPRHAWAGTLSQTARQRTHGPRRITRRSEETASAGGARPFAGSSGRSPFGAGAAGKRRVR